MLVIQPSDLAPYLKIDDETALGLIGDAIATATSPTHAPGLLEEEFQYEAAARAIIVRAIARSKLAGPGGTRSVTKGPWGESTTTSVPKVFFWPEEIAELQALCRTEATASHVIPRAKFPPPLPWPL